MAMIINTSNFHVPIRLPHVPKLQGRLLVTVVLMYFNVSSMLTLLPPQRRSHRALDRPRVVQA